MRTQQFLSAFLVTSLCCFATPALSATPSSASDPNIEALFEKDYSSYLEQEEGSLMLQAWAAFVIAEAGSDMQPDQLIACFKKVLEYPGIREKYLQLYAEKFSKEDAEKVQALLKNDLYTAYRRPLEEIGNFCAMTTLGVLVELLQEVKTCESDETAPVNTHTVIDITDKNVDDVLSTYPLLVIDLYADWCVPCKMFAPIFKEVSGELGDKYQFAKLDAGTLRSTADRFKINSLPTVLFLKNGKEVARKSGRLSKSEFVSAMEKAFDEK